MKNPSNLYAEKVFAEHPLALWALDDDISFISLLDNNEKAISGWTISNGSFVATSGITPQVESSPTIGVSTSNSDPLELTSPTIISSALLNQDKNSITISSYFKSAVDTTVTIGYSAGASSVISEVFEYIPLSQDDWAFLSATFDIPVAIGDIKIHISLQQDIDIESEFFFNNLSFGQWIDSSNTVSSGVVLSNLSDYDSIKLAPGIKAVPSRSYGLAGNDAYYLGSEKQLFAYNDGFPMVYGASNITKILPADAGSPSLIIPGFGFLNDAGKYTDMTAEMWLRITPQSSDSMRIFGPISSDDGLYVHGEFLVVKIGDSIGSYFVGEWGRPMLINFRVTVNTASLLVDGEQVISITTNTESLVLPKPFVTISNIEYKQDWLGFYSYDGILSYEIDCVAIYSYQVPELVAKRRFVYGQGVEFPELSSSSLIGASTFIDYRVANYANNYMYPDIGRWSQGITDNAVIENNSLMSPKYDLPDITFNNKGITTAEWLEKCSLSDGNEIFASIDLSLADSAAKQGGYIYFPKLKMLSGDLNGLYGVFKTTSTSDQILFSIQNSVDGSSFIISTNGNKIKYELSYGQSQKITAYSQELLETGKIFAAGIDIEKLSNTFGGAISKFFGAAAKLSVYVGGTQSFENTFAGRIYKVSFSTKRNINKLSNYISSNGILAIFEGNDVFVSAGLASTYVWDNEYVGGLAETVGWDSVVTAGSVDSQAVFEIMAHIGSYTLNPRIYLGSFILDISAESYWQDYVPLSYLSKSLLNASGDREDTLDFIQFNISNPSIPAYSLSSYDTTNSQVKTYVTFQYMSVGPNQDHESFVYTSKLSKTGVVQPTGNWLLTRYEVVDDTIIYLPSDADFNDLAIVMHIEIESKAIIGNPIKIKSLQLASQALSSIEPTNISTKFGETLATYTMQGIYPNYKAKNPVSIYKSSTPYLYLTNTSGIRMRGMLESTKRRGIRSRINSQRSNLYRVGAMQILSQYFEPEFLGTPQKLVTISAKNKTVSIYVEASNDLGTRGRVFALNDKTGLKDDTIVFFLNGVVVKDLYITPNTWNMVGIQFKEPLDFNSMVGYLDITGPLLVHGMSNYRLTSSQDSITSILRTWSQVRTMIDKGTADVTNWEDFVEGSSYGIFTWENILYIPTQKQYLVDPRTSYRLYTGTNKIIVGDNNRLRFKNYSYKVYNDVRWQSSVHVAV